MGGAPVALTHAMLEDVYTVAESPVSNVCPEVDLSLRGIKPTYPNVPAHFYVDISSPLCNSGAVFGNVPACSVCSGHEAGEGSASQRHPKSCTVFWLKGVSIML